MKSANVRIRQIRSWIRSPGFYVEKAWRMLNPVDPAIIHGDRDRFELGSEMWLAVTEAHYGGLQRGGAHTGLNGGGDRMSPFYHAYGRCYEEFLRNWMCMNQQKITLIEVGILNGTGLAIWCDLFPQARIIGLDIDLSNFQANLLQLQRLGAFSKNRPELHVFDQLNPAGATAVIEQVMGTSMAEIVIDDGCHSNESIVNTFAVLSPRLAKNGVYFVEDNFDTYDILAPLNPRMKWTTRGEIAVGLWKNA